MSEPVVLAERYELIRPLGQGAMGRVWLGTDRLLERPVAIKELIPSAFDADAAARAVREARLAGRLSHANAVAVYDLVVVDERPHVVMEYVAGVTLADRIAQGPIDLETAADIFAQVAAALSAAHRLGIVHRDVKPANILLDEHGTAKLADFGIARNQGTVGLTQAGTVIGTLAYMAPEIAQGQMATGAADIWSLGATAYSVTEQRPIFTADSDAALYVRLISQTPDWPAKSGALAEPIMAMLQKDPADRPAAADLQRQLARIAHAGPPTGATAVTTAAVPDRPPAPPVHGTGPTVVSTPSAAVPVAAAGAPPAPPTVRSTADQPPQPESVTEQLGLSSDPTAARTPRPTRDDRRRNQTTPRRRWPWAVGATAVVALIALGVGLLVKNNGGANSAATTESTGSALPITPATPSTSVKNRPVSAQPLPDNVMVFPHSTGDGTSAIWRVQSDGGQASPIPNTGPHADVPVLSHDRRTIAYYVPGPNKTSSIFLVGAGGESNRPLFATPDPRCPTVGRPAFAPDGQHLALACTVANQTTIYLVDLYGQISNVLVHAGTLGDPTYRSDGAEIAFWLAGAGVEADAYLARVPTQVGPFNTTPINTGVTHDNDPGWSADGQEIVFRRDTDGNPDIWTVKVTNGPAQRLTNSADAETVPSFSPDGKQIAYVRTNAANVAQLWIMNSDGTNQHPVTAGSSGDGPPDWTAR